jgi:hypothetical protein
MPQTEIDRSDSIEQNGEFPSCRGWGFIIKVTAFGMGLLAGS